MNYQQIEEHHAEQTRDVLGNNIVLCHSECMLGPHYYVFIPTFLCVSALLIVLFINVKEIISPMWSIIVVLSIVLLMVSYLLVGFSNPGIVTGKLEEINNEQPELNRKYCELCGIVRPIGARHCNQCYDHHCPWIGKCVGAENKGRFCFFLVMMFGTLILFFAATVSSAKSA